MSHAFLLVPVRRMPSMPLLAMVLSLVTSMAAAEPLKLSLCVDEHPHPPYILADGNGTVPILIKMATAQVGVSVVFHRAPLARCIQEIRENLADGYPSVANSPTVLSILELPRNNGSVDATRATATARLMVFRRKDSPVAWDGKHFTNISLPALMPFGSVFIGERLKDMAMPFDDKGRDLGSNFSKLLARRGDVAIGFENDGQELMNRPEFAGKIDVLPTPFAEENYYLGVSKPCYSKNQEQIEALWNAIATLRKSPEYQTAIKNLHW